VAGGSLVAAAFMSSFGMQLFFLTQYLQQVLAEGPFVAGLMFLPLVLTVVVGNQLGGRLVERWGSARTLAAGMAFGALGLLVNVLLPPTESLAVLLPGMAVAGLGQGVAFTTLYLAAGTGAFAGEQGVASAVTSTAQQLGASIGLAGLGGPAQLAGCGPRWARECAHRCVPWRADRRTAQRFRCPSRHRASRRGGGAGRHRKGTPEAPLRPGSGAVGPRRPGSPHRRMNHERTDRDVSITTTWRNG
jgi:hypothetical protein